MVLDMLADRAERGEKNRRKRNGPHHRRFRDIRARLEELLATAPRYRPDRRAVVDGPEPLSWSRTSYRKSRGGAGSAAGSLPSILSLEASPDRAPTSPGMPAVRIDPAARRRRGLGRWSTQPRSHRRRTSGACGGPPIRNIGKPSGLSRHARSRLGRWLSYLTAPVSRIRLRVAARRTIAGRNRKQDGGGAANKSGLKIPALSSSLLR